MIVKICGLTTPDDAVLCHRAGADWLGVILTASPRAVTVERCRAIRAAVPGAPLIGVVRTTDPGAVSGLVRAARLDAVQLHGCADPAVWTAVHAACGRPVLPAVAAGQATAELLAAYRELTARRACGLLGLLLDLPKAPAAGGEARAAGDRPDALLWSAARRASDAGAPVILAGGLTAGTVADAVRAVRPRGLALCRGTERAAGHKDPELVRRVLDAARTVEVPRAS